MRNMMVITALIAGAALFAGCGNNGNPEPSGYAPGQSSEAYAYIHGGYVGQAVVTTTSDGEIEVRLDEAFMPHTLALVDMDDDAWTEDNTVTYRVRGNDQHAAKYVSYNGVTYVGEVVGGALVYVEADGDGNPVGEKDLEKLIIHGQDSMAAYFDRIQNGEFGIMTEFGGTVEPVTTTAYGDVVKRGSSYWDRGPLGWHGNIEAIEQFIAENGVNFGLNEMVRASEEDEDGLRMWSAADAVTGATLSDFKDYFTLAQTAEARLAR